MASKKIWMKNPLPLVVINNSKWGGDGKTASSTKDIWGIGTKSVSTSQNKGFVEKINLH